MKTWVPFPSPPQCDTSHGLWKGQEPPRATAASHWHVDGGGGGAEEGWAGWEGVPWQGVGEEQGEEPGLQPAELRFRNLGKGCGRRDDWLMISGGAVEGVGDPMAEKGACELHAAC